MLNEQQQAILKVKEILAHLDHLQKTATEKVYLEYVNMAVEEIQQAAAKALFK